MKEIKIILLVLALILISAFIYRFNIEKKQDSCYQGLCDFSYYNGSDLIINMGCCDNWNGERFIEVPKPETKRSGVKG